MSLLAPPPLAITHAITHAVTLAITLQLSPRPSTLLSPDGEVLS
jgi:hypothetical protein